MAQKTITLEISNAPVAVSVACSRRRTWQISVTPDGRVTLKAPLSATSERLDEILRSRTAWITRTRDRILRRVAEAKGGGYHDGSEWFVFGRPRVLNLSVTQSSEPRFAETETGWQAALPVEWPSAKQESWLSKALNLWFHRHAKEYFSLRVEFWAITMGLPVPALAIKKHKRLWGSCNKFRRTLNLNWKIIAFHPAVIDYIIIHELCHLRHADHSKRFWLEVGRWYPEWRVHRKWLKDEAHKYALPD